MSDYLKAIISLTSSSDDHALMIGMLLANQLLVIKFTQEEINSEDNSF